MIVMSYGTQKLYESSHWGDTLSKCVLLYFLGTNIYTLGTSEP